MRCLLLLGLACSAAIAQVTYQLPFGSNGNTLALAIENPGDMAISNLTIFPARTPDWIHLESGTIQIGPVAGGQTVTAFLRFSVGIGAPVGESAILAIDLNDELGGHWRKEIQVSVAPPSESLLLPNYPNPFNPTTTVAYQLSSAGKVRLSVYDLLGREIVVLEDDERPAGYHEATIDAGKWASGVYILRLNAEHGGGWTFTAQRMITVVK